MREEREKPQYWRVAYVEKGWTDGPEERNAVGSSGPSAGGADRRERGRPEGRPDGLEGEAPSRLLAGPARFALERKGAPPGLATEAAGQRGTRNEITGHWCKVAIVPSLGHGPWGSGIGA